MGELCFPSHSSLPLAMGLFSFQKHVTFPTLCYRSAVWERCHAILLPRPFLLKKQTTEVQGHRGAPEEPSPHHRS